MSAPMRSLASLALLAALTLASCRGGGGRRAMTDAGADGTTKPAPTSAADASPAPSPPVPTPAGVPAYCPTWDYDLGLEKARGLSAKKRFDEAALAIAGAIRARPYDPLAHLELAHIRYLAGKTDLDSVRQARRLAKDRAIQASIAYEEGLAETRLGHPDAARIAFVRAERLGSRAAGAKLGGASRCTVAPIACGDDRISLLSTWREVLDAVQASSTCDKVTAATEDQARSLACGGCAGIGETWQPGRCDGDGPFELATGYMSCHGFGAMIQKLPGGRFYVAASIGEKLERDKTSWIRSSKLASWDWVTGPVDDGREATYRQGEGWSDFLDAAKPGCLADESAEAELVLSSGCQASMGAEYDDGEERTYYFDDGRCAAKLRLCADDVGAVRITVGAASIAVRGHGCAFDVPLGAGDAGADAAR